METVLEIFKAFNSGTKKWLQKNTTYLVKFIHNLTQVERFGMATEFLDESEKDEILKLLGQLENNLSLLTETDEITEEESEILGSQLSAINQIFE